MKKQIIAVLAVAACIFTACGNQGEEQVTSVEITATQTEATELSKETVLPDGWTMDELRNILIINGQTLTLPTTLNKIMELDDKFSYTYESYEDSGIIIKIEYNNKYICTSLFSSDTDDVNKIQNQDIYYLSFGRTNCQETNLDVNLSPNISFGCSYENIKNVFKDPNVYNYDDTNKEYEFYDDEYKCKLKFEINSENKLSFFEVKISPINGGQ